MITWAHHFSLPHSTRAHHFSLTRLDPITFTSLDSTPLSHFWIHSRNNLIREGKARQDKVTTVTWFGFKLGRNATYNTKHGFRVSKTIIGLTLGLRRGGTILRGRWSNSNNLLNLNLSKSCFSFSTSSRFGTYNWTKPNYSSSKLAGIQLRGKKGG